jgi:deazaflavin-dependent oxidoreductase (nitroreductase family)
MSLSGDYEPSPKRQVRDQVNRYVMSGGREGRTLRGRPVVVLTSRGGRSGKLRKTPVMRVEYCGRYALVASAGGSATNPCWYHNLLANPIVDLQDGPVTRQWKARELFGDEKVEWSVRADAAYPFYVVERARAGREIPIYVLEPASRPDSPPAQGAAERH